MSQPEKIFLEKTGRDFALPVFDTIVNWNFVIYKTTFDICIKSGFRFIGAGDENRTRNLSLGS